AQIKLTTDMRRWAPFFQEPLHGFFATSDLKFTYRHLSVLAFIQCRAKGGQQHVRRNGGALWVSAVSVSPACRRVASRGTAFSNNNSVAVGMPVTRHPPHRSGRALLTHPAPASSQPHQR